MAPVRRATTTAQRETRATRAAAIAKKHAVVAEKNADTVGSQRLQVTASKSATASTTTRKSRRTTEDTKEEPDKDGQNAAANSKNDISSQSLRATSRSKIIPSTGLTAAPRRRLKITPLTSSNSESAAPTTMTNTATDGEQGPSRKVSSERTKSDVEGESIKSSNGGGIAALKSSTSKKTSTKSAVTEEDSITSSGRLRGRPKIQQLDSKDPAISQGPDHGAPVRKTRSRKANTQKSADDLAPPTDVTIPKSDAVVRKKVTFQDLPNENDKENQPLPSAKAKTMVVKKTTESKGATGMRARPLRKATNLGVVSASRKSARSSVQDEDNASADKETADSRKRIVRVLTPKKITQVARSSSPDRDESEQSDGEDELNGSKTPVRDLSMSPRRPPTVAIARSLSPAKKLVFGQNIIPQELATHSAIAENKGVLASPARRPAGSPFKDGLRESPKRMLNNSTKLIFPNAADLPSTSSQGISAGSTATQNMTNLLQSPKRVLNLDANFFSQSAIKASAKKSPFKASLFGTPAKRLFSPKKGSSATFIGNDNSEFQTEVSASSHYRSSTSPLRVVRIEADFDDFNIEDSVLQVGTPLKVLKSPIKGHFVDESGAATSSIAIGGMVEPRDDGDSHSFQPIEPLNLDLGFQAMDVVDDQSDPSDIQSHNGSSMGIADQNLGAVSDEIETVLVDDEPKLPKQTFAQTEFRSVEITSENDSSEDELAKDHLPIQRKTRVGRALTRQSIGTPSLASGEGFGFTPLANQMNGWLASSPAKGSDLQKFVGSKTPSFEFSPLAQQHIDGEVVVSRDSTPAQKLRLNRSAQKTSEPRTKFKKSIDLRQSLGSSQHNAYNPAHESPARDTQFDEYMEMRAIESLEHSILRNDSDLNLLQDSVEDDLSLQHNTDTAVEDASENGGDEEGSSLSESPAGDLTTDLIKFTNASDTAMVDFQKLADEANELASDPTGTETAEILTSESSSIAESDKVAKIVYPVVDPVAEVAVSPRLEPLEIDLDSPSMLIIGEIDSPTHPASLPTSSPQPSPRLNSQIMTPKQTLRLDEPRFLNTVVSKIPLKPEGCISPIKMPRKRARSFGHVQSSPNKRISIEDLRSLPLPEGPSTSLSPDRCVRTSGAPSPGGTSTPAIKKIMATPSTRASHRSTSAYTTPGQTSFAIDDFGDSTLDGIDLPDDFSEDEDLRTMATPGDAASSRTPQTIVSQTPVTVTRAKCAVTTPAPATKKTPRNPQGDFAKDSATTNLERTPLEPLGKGTLHGATIFVDVFTSEGADASGIFTDLLTQMGAKCVREWKWNPRASTAPCEEAEAPVSKIGITHVVFKDGSKRTLDKVRSAKGEVCCVGVAWVLDCERENKWLDETTYQVDTSLLPRGGSKRRKSMQPRTLLVADDGSVSTSRARRSVSAEMNELMKRELINTPARRHMASDDGSLNHDKDGDEDDDDDTENVEQATPTGFVSYDPRVAMTPGTPYLVSQGKKLTQMSAPPKQSNKSLFDNEDEDEENDDTLLAGGTGGGGIGEKGNAGVVRDAKKFKMKNLGDMAKRRRTLGWRPIVGSPLGRN